MRENPWTDLPLGETGTLSVLRIAGLSSLEAFWARKPDGRLALLVSLHRIGELPEEVPTLRGIEILVLPQDRQIQFVLESSGDWEMFKALCLDLLTVANGGRDEASALQLLFQRLHRWQRLLSKGGARRLDEHEIRGLMGELLFLRDRLLPVMGAAAVDCWQGPLGQPQDFVYAGRLVEVKTYAAGSNPSIRISSAEQLSSGDVPLFLHLVCLVRQNAALNLPALADEIRSMLSANPVRLDSFEDKLLVMGYIDMPEYRSLSYAVTSTSDYRVGEGFPRLTVEQVPAGVTDVSYSIRLFEMRSFAVAADLVMSSAGRQS